LPFQVLVEHDLFGKPVPTFPDHARDAAVAQPVEQRIRNAWVGGSNPLRGTSSPPVAGRALSTHFVIMWANRRKFGFESSPRHHLTASLPGLPALSHLVVFRHAFFAAGPAPRRVAPIGEDDRDDRDSGRNSGFDVIRHLIPNLWRSAAARREATSIISHRRCRGLVRRLWFAAEILLQVTRVIAVEQVPDHAAIQI
jgi:hypothetical protein